MHPSQIGIEEIPTDFDGIKDRVNDITYSDRNSYYDQMMMDTMTDYAALVIGIKEMVKDMLKDKDERNTFEKEFKRFVKTTKVKSHTGLALKKPLIIY